MIRYYHSSNHLQYSNARHKYIGYKIYFVSNIFREKVFNIFDIKNLLLLDCLVVFKEDIYNLMFIKNAINLKQLSLNKNLMCNKNELKKHLLICDIKLNGV